MPTLDWIGKKAVLNHHNEVPYRLLRCNRELSVGDPGSGNLLVQGDNLEALKALLPYYAGRVKCIYIDPPYNTGNENWVYNDAVNSPEMQAWLGRVVGNESEDLSRHDKWLCMMYPRLRLLRDFLRPDGAIFVSVDDNEVHNLRYLLDAVFGPNNMVAMLVWQKRVSPANDAKYFSSDHEYVVVYARSKRNWRPNRLRRTDAQARLYTNPDNDPRGPWNSTTCTCNKSAEERPNLYFAVTNPNTGATVLPRRTAVWKFDRARYESYVADNRLYWGKDGRSRMPRLKRFLSEMGDVVPRSVLLYAEHGHTQEARSELLGLVPGAPFTTPKPVRLVKRLLEIGTDNDSIVLDSYSGSGTTGHAVLALNRATAGHRRFILVEMEPAVCRGVAVPRLGRAIRGYERKSAPGGDVSVPGLGGGFRYCELGPTLFDAEGRIRAEVTFRELAQHVYFTETGEPLPVAKNGKTPLLGVHNGTAVYLLYNGVLKDKSPGGGNVLTREVLRELPEHEGPKVVYGTACRLGQRILREEGITFRQVPYEIRTR